MMFSSNLLLLVFDFLFVGFVDMMNDGGGGFENVLEFWEIFFFF